MPLEAGELVQIATAIQALQPAEPAVNAVAIKLPTFWTIKPELWFAQTEAQFETRQINTDQTKYNYVVSSLDNAAAIEVEALLLNPPEVNLYPTLKAALIAAFGKTQVERDAELLSLSGLGDRKPSALLRHIRSLNSNPETLLRAFFLAQLPAEVCRVLAAVGTDDLETLAIQADRCMEAANTGYGSRIISSIEERPPAGSRGQSRSYPRKKASEEKWCFFHAKFGRSARKCSGKDCPLRNSIVNAVEQSDLSCSQHHSGNESAGRSEF